ncbi:MAG TPA: polysaccharide ABC transporter ATP-binding protein [Candidatus Dormibacteraeota bacterium]|nr:polysaccharide ABC transporter ATP-binding protein [Candidatus Dormibacteraeota bacterium]
MSETVIRASGLSKRYRLGSKVRYRALRDTLTDALRAPARLWNRREGGSKPFFWALRDVSFEVQAGEVLGVVGRNGAGKTTLLKVLSRITRPTGGRAQIRGRVGSLLEVGTGFHPELTGRENIQLSAAILGMPRRELVKRFDAIVDFSGVESFLDTQLKHYSSGMQTRLGFAVAAHLDPDILFIDEVLAVGDLEFQRKCLGKMGEVARDGRTVIFVSHHMNQIRSLCSRCLWLDRGSIREEGDTQTVVAAYESAVLSGEAHVADSKKVQLYQWEITGSQGQEDHRIEQHAPACFRFHAFLPKPIVRGVLGIHLDDELGRVIWHLDWSFTNLEAGPCVFHIRFPYLPLRPGPYMWRGAIFDGGEWAELEGLIPPLIMATQPIAYTQANFHSILDLPFEIEAHSTGQPETSEPSGRSSFPAVERP